MSDSLSTIYLNDHLALITAELELARRVGRENEPGSLATFLAAYIDELDRQKQWIEETIIALGGEKSSLKQAAGWLAEKLGRLKPNASLISYSDLSRVIELEALASAAYARLLLWEALTSIEASTLQSASSVDWTDAAEATSQQLILLRQRHREALQQAFKAA